MLGKTYQKMMEQVTPSEELLYRTKRRIEHQKPKRTMKRLILVVVTICICISISLTVLAANGMLFNIAPQLAQFMQPIELSSESEGITMNVVSAMNDDETAIVYLTLQDVEADRIDKTVDLYNYSIRGYSAFTHEVVHYDEQTKTATIRLLANGGEKLNGKKVTLKLSSFLSKKKTYEDVPLSIDLKNLEDVQTIPLDLNNIPGGGGEGFEALLAKQTMPVLKPSHQSPDFVAISGVGYVDGLLHIQTDWADSVDNHGFITLTDANGKEIQSYANLYFGLDQNGNTTYGRRYVEHLFQIPKENLPNVKAKGTFVENQNYTEGNWQVTFKIQAVNSSAILKKNVQIEGQQIDEVKITPMGISLSSVVDMDGLEISAILKDGKQISYTHSISIDRKQKILPELPIDISQIQEIRIGKSRINLQ